MRASEERGLDIERARVQRWVRERESAGLRPHSSGTRSNRRPARISQHCPALLDRRSVGRGVSDFASDHHHALLVGLCSHG